MAGGNKRSRKGGGLLPALCNLLGIGILLCIILSCLPLTLPRYLGYEVYNVVSGSMEPEIPVGSILYVKAEAPEDIAEGDVIAFYGSSGVIAHRVVRNHLVEGEFTTKGDANAGEDLNTVSYASLIGRVVRHYPLLGRMLFLYNSGMGKLYIICLAACGVMLNLLAGILRGRRTG